MIGLLEVVGLAGTLIAVVAWITVSFLAPGRNLEGLTSQRASALGRNARAWLYAPVWVPAVLLGAAVLPGLLGELFAHGDHCLEQAAIHHHLCLLHPPHPAGHVLPMVMPLTILLPMSVALLLCSRRALSEWRLARSLILLSVGSNLGHDVRVLDQDEPLALTVGWRRPVVLLSTGLLRRAGSETLAVVLAHERAHVARRDTIYALLDRLAASLLPRSVAEPLLARVALAREHACDLLASRVVGGSVTVARALAEVVRLRMANPVVGVSMASGGVESRVRLLLAEGPSRRRWPIAALAVGVAMLLAGMGPIHSVVEYAVALLVH